MRAALELVRGGWGLPSLVAWGPFVCNLVQFVNCNSGDQEGIRIDCHHNPACLKWPVIEVNNQHRASHPARLVMQPTPLKQHSTAYSQ